MNLPVSLNSPARRRALIIASLVALTAIGYYAAFAFIFGFRLPAPALRRLVQTLPYLLVLRLLLQHRLRLDRGYWQHVGLQDALRLIAAATIGSVAFPLVLLVLGDLHDIPPGVFVLDWMFAIAFTGGVRLTARLLHEGWQYPRATPSKRTFIVGAGNAGEQLLRQILHDAHHQYDVVGLIDDDPAKIGWALHGVPVVGTTQELRGLTALHHAAVGLIAMPSASPEQLRRVVDACVDARIEVKLLPPLQDLAGAAQITQVRDVEIEDLLGREPVKLDLAVVGPDIAGKVVLVTGAGGSIGSELARQIARLHPAQLILLERAESPLYFIQLEVAQASPDVDVVPVLASVTNVNRLQAIFETYRPHVVFHAAAYKHVPMLEGNVVEGVWNNVMGSLRLARCAARAGTEKFVLISTDKAVNPSSILGATKRVAERIVLELPSLRASATDFRVVRFGNVLGSDGSVVPVFKRQLAAGGPLTVTHPEVRRYFMTIPEAVQLVLHAAALPEGAGRIALLEMGTQIRVVDLAEQLIKLAGFTPHKDIEIVFTGLRPGEKLEEELLGPNERATPTSVDKIRVLERDGVSGAALAQQLRALVSVSARNDPRALIRALTGLVPEYQPDMSVIELRSYAPRRASPKGHAFAGASRNGHNGTRRIPAPASMTVARRSFGTRGRT